MTVSSPVINQTTCNQEPINLEYLLPLSRDQIRNLITKRRIRVMWNLQYAKEHNEPVFRLEPIPIECASVKVEAEISGPEPEWFRIKMGDPAVPSFCSFEKPYFGSRKLVSVYLERIGKELQLTPCRLLEYRKLYLNDVFWIHKNIWQSSYYLKAERIVLEQALLECMGWYYLCIRPEFYGMKRYSLACSEWVPMTDHFWGTPGILKKEENVITTSLFIAQNFFDSAEDGHHWMYDLERLDFTQVCDETFGDG